MSRFTGPRLKVMRALGVDLPGLSRKTKEARPNPPGQHGARAIRRKKSDFGVQLIEKQKLRFNYGLTERQLRRLMVDARKSKEPTGAAAARAPARQRGFPRRLCPYHCCCAAAREPRPSAAQRQNGEHSFDALACQR